MQTHHLKVLALAAAASAALVGSAAWAQAPSRAQFDIPAQDLGAALRSLGVQAGREVLFDPAVVRGRQAPAVRGEMEISAALNQLLAGQGLRSRATGGAIVIERSAAPAPAMSKTSAPGALVAASPPAEPAEIEEIVVVGSNIAGVSERGLLPVSVVDG